MQTGFCGWGKTRATSALVTIPLASGSFLFSLVSRQTAAGKIHCADGKGL